MVLDQKNNMNDVTIIYYTSNRKIERFWPVFGWQDKIKWTP